MTVNWHPIVLHGKCCESPGCLPTFKIGSLPPRESTIMSRTQFAVIAAITAVLLCSACNGKPDAGMTPTGSPTPSLSDASESPTQVVPTYLQDLTHRQRSAFSGALRAYHAFLAEQSKIVTSGKATPAARLYYQRRTADWQTYWATLQQRVADGISIRGTGRVIRVRPGNIRLHADDTGTVGLQVCGSSKGVRVFDDGKELPQPTAEPRTVKVAMVKLHGESGWRVLYERAGARC